MLKRYFILKKEIECLLYPSKLWARSEVLAQPSPVPKEAGAYAWYFRKPPHGVPVPGCHTFKGLTLLYTGISPRQPPANGVAASRQTLFNRIRYHFRGNAYASTLRLTLGCLLTKELRIELRRVGSGKRMTFAGGEKILSQWMENNAFVAWCVHPKPWLLEEYMISHFSLPLNLDQNKAHSFHKHLSQLRSNARERARSTLPIVS